MNRQSATQRNRPIAAAQPAAPPRYGTRFGGYFRPEDIAADRWVHLTALILCIIGVPVLLGTAGAASPRIFIACSVYAITLVVLFACSTAFYHLRLRVERRRLRQFDHAAIFLLIAGTCTPFTTALLHGSEAVAVSAVIWATALAGAAYKLARPLSFPGFSTTGNLLLAATVLVGLEPVLRAADPRTAALIVAGLAIYLAGALLRRRPLRYRNTIWHLMVIAGAACHYAAILCGIVLRG